MFLAPEFRHLFYLLCAVVPLVYCPLMSWLGRRRFFRSHDAAGEPVGTSNAQAVQDLRTSPAFRNDHPRTLATGADEWRMAWTRR